MTDTMNPNLDSDEATDEEVSASESFDLASLGIDAMTTPIDVLLKVYREQADICNKYAASLKAGSDDPNDVANVVKANLAKQKKTDPSVASLRAVGSSITEAYFTKTPATSSLLSSAVLLEELENLVSLARDEYNYHYNAAVQALKDEKGIKSTPAEAAVNAKLACIKLKGSKPGQGLINARIMIAQATGMEDQIPSNLYNTTGQRKGFNTDVFPRLPRLDVDNPHVTGVTHRLTFRFKAVGQEEATSIGNATLNDVAHNVVSNGAYRVTGKDISDQLKKAGHGIGATDTEWALEFKSGTLYGKKESV
jgi:hypothetical protein